MQLLKKCIISGLQTDAFLDFTITNVDLALNDLLQFTSRQIEVN